MQFLDNENWRNELNVTASIVLLLNSELFAPSMQIQSRGTIFRV